MELLGTGCCDSPWPRCFENGTGQMYGGKVPPRLQAMLGTCNLFLFLFFWVLYLWIPDARQWQQVSFCVLSDTSGGPLWDKERWTRWAFGLLHQGPYILYTAGFKKQVCKQLPLFKVNRNGIILSLWVSQSAVIEGQNVGWTIHLPWKTFCHHNHDHIHTPTTQGLKRHFTKMLTIS